MIAVRHILRLACCWAAAAGHGIAAPAFDQLDLTTAIQLALLQNRDLGLQRNRILTAEYGIDRARAEFAFRLEPDGTASLTEGNEAFGYGLALKKRFARGADTGLRAGYLRFADDDDDDDDPLERASVRLQVSQPLFRNAGRLVNQEPVVAATQSHRTALRLLEQQKADLVLAVVLTFEAIVRLEQQVAADRAFRERIDKLVALTHARERQGRATRIDTLRAELLGGQAAGRLTANQEQLASLRLDFADLVGASPGYQPRLEPGPLVDLDLPGLGDMETVARRNRLDVAQALQNLEDAARGLRIARRALWPTLRIVGRAEQFGEGDSFNESTDLDEFTWTLGLESDTDFVRARERADLSRQVVDVATAEQQLDILDNRVVRDVRQQHLAYQRAHRNLATADRNLQLAVDRVRLSRRRFEQGRGDSFTVTDAEDSFVLAQQQRLTARADASIAGYRLLHALGTLVETPAGLRASPVGGTSRRPTGKPAPTEGTP